jgi:hypothetical protein
MNLIKLYSICYAHNTHTSYARSIMIAGLTIMFEHSTLRHLISHLHHLLLASYDHAPFVRKLDNRAYAALRFYAAIV